MTARRAAVDFAAWIRDLVDGHYAADDRIQIVVDNLSTHTPAAFYEASRPAMSRMRGAKMSPSFSAVPTAALRASCPRPRKTPPLILPPR